MKINKLNKNFQDDYINYLLRSFENEDKRLDIIESKISQLIKQSGLIMSIVSFIIPLLYDSLVDMSFCFKLFIGVIFSITILLIGMSIYNASKVLRINDFRYSDCSTDTLLKEYDKLRDFKKEYINDLIFSINNNRVQNDRKGSILIKASNFFVYSVYSLIGLTFVLLIVFFLS